MFSETIQEQAELFVNNDFFQRVDHCPVCRRLIDGSAVFCDGDHVHPEHWEEYCKVENPLSRPVAYAFEDVFERLINEIEEQWKKIE